MREILPNKLWLGNLNDAKDIQQLMDVGVSVVFDLAYEELSPKLPRSMVYCRFPILDGLQSSRQILFLAIETLIRLLKTELPTFVFCSAGMSRSPAIVAAALSLLHGRPLEEQLFQVVAGHPHDISPQLWADVKEICKSEKFQYITTTCFQNPRGNEDSLQP
jgi:protein-tyrosine phosphatase